MRQLATSVVLAILVGACAHTALPRTDPIPVDASLSMQLAPAARTLDSAIAAGAAPGAVLAVSAGGRHFEHAIGQLAVDDSRPPNGRTIYDMASLTKVVALTTIAMMAVEEHRIALDSPVVHYLPEFAHGSGEKSRVLVRDLLLHDSGLPPDPIPPLWKHPGSRNSALTEALGANLDTIPGARMVYSDLGAITLATIIERQYHERIDRLFAERVARPLGFTRMRYLPPREWRDEIASTEIETVPGRPTTALRGDVHDENAWRLDGVSGHAGLFSDADDLLRFGEWVLAGSLGRTVPGALQPPAELVTWSVRQNQPEGSSRALGWDTPSENSSAGHYMSARSFGHTGYTGTSIWIDPTRDLVIVLLTNRVNPTRDTPKFGMLRAVVADAVMMSLYPDVTPRELSPQ
ncbi:MAG TPA: serine hydrolase domain-containing protein [Gemmatimonadaceae bacterium]|jgi:CubicO group peptidase (beta-lactamase class C family)|nr:serine hydrolase domain-containing protein [Gemmatimonadaceae bacterium]